MIRAFNSFLTTIGFVLLLSFATFAQTDSTGFEIEKFRELATRAEGVVSSGQASTDALEILRSDLVQYRSEALNTQEARARRVTTIQEQITALGAVPEGEVQEANTVSERRAELNGQLAEARAPLIVAQEAFERASGLIAEIDKIIRGRARTALLQSNRTPISPILWSETIAALGKHISEISAEIRTEWDSDLEKKLRKQNGPVMLLLVAIGLILMIPLTRWATRRLIRERSKRPTALGNVKFLLASLAVFFFPMTGLVCLFGAVYIFDSFALRGDLLLNAIPSAGLALFCANWLARHMPMGNISNVDGDENEDADDATQLIPAAQRLTWAMGCIIAVGYLIGGLDDGANWSVDIFSTLMFPLIVLLGCCLFQGGRLIAAYRKILHVDDDIISIPERIATIFMWACYLTGLGGPILAAFGYYNAGEMLVFSMSMTLALSAAIFFAYSLFVRFISPPTDASQSKDRPSGGLYKVTIAFTLLCVSIPIFALIWGARISDISGLWFTLNEGVALGDTRISISDFLIFILIFFIGYTITRLLQTTLRTIVFPNTQIESGAQNALVTGFGYVGIFLAAMLAITSTGLDLSSLAIVAGALSLGIGFGLQAIVSNFVSGIILLIERPVKIGDWVEVGAYSGTIRSVSVRSTSVETFDGATVIIPNADLIAGTVTNWTHGNVRGRVKVPVGVAYGTDPELVQEVLLAIADDHPMVLKLPAPKVVFMGFGADSMDFQLRGILRDVNYVLGTMSDINFEIVKQFKANNIEIPFAQREVTIKNAQDFFPKAAKAARKPRAKPKT